MAVFLFYNFKKIYLSGISNCWKNLLRSEANFPNIGRFCHGMEHVFRIPEDFAPEWSMFSGHWKILPRNGACFLDECACRSNLEQIFKATGRLGELYGRMDGRQDGFKKRIFTNQIKINNICTQ
jgi:hypothetical protein